MRQQRTEPAAIEAEIAHLRSLALDALRRRWRAVFGQTPPAPLSKDLLGRMMAWRLQEQAFGGLDRESLSFLEGFGAPRRLAPPSAQTRHGARSRLSRPASYRHRRAGWLRLAGNDLCEPLGHRPRHHRHGLEWPPVLRPST